MSIRHAHTTASLGLSLALGCAALPAFAESSVFATGLAGPIKLASTERGGLLVTERGSGANDGRLSVIDRNGNVRALLSGLPSGIEVTGQPSGPQAVVADGCCSVELTIGEGDTLRFAESGPPAQRPNPLAPSSPLFSSVLRVVFDAPFDELEGGFALTRLVDHETLADGFTVRFENDAGERSWIKLVADLKDFRPDPATNVRGSNPFGMTREHDGGSLLLTDGGQNSIVEVGVLGPPKTLLRFRPVDNPPGTVPPRSDAVPTGIRHLAGDRYLVTLFGGVPFANGSASVHVFDADKRKKSVLIPKLTSAIDVLPLGGAIYVLEHSASVFAGQPTGRLLRFSRPDAKPREVATQLDTPTSVVYSSKQRAFFVTELGAGRIRRIEP